VSSPATKASFSYRCTLTHDRALCCVPVMQGSVWPLGMGVPPFRLRASLTSLDRPPAVLIEERRQGETGISAMQPYVQDLAASRACVIPRGAGMHSYRLAEAVSCGCVPVVLADHWVMPFEDAATSPSQLARHPLTDANFEAWASSLLVGRRTWPRPRVHVVAATPSTEHSWTDAQNTWATLQDTAWAKKRSARDHTIRSVNVTVGPYYIRIDEQDWWALPRVVQWAKSTGLLQRLQARLDLAWRLLYDSPVRAAISVVRARHVQ
jgi:hypothetical protein